MTDVQDKSHSSQAQRDEALRRFVDGFSSPPRSPVLHWPSEHDLEYEDVTFLAHDGVPIEAWFIPAPGSRKLIIANHPLGFTRSGIPTHLEPWHAAWAPSGNGFEVDLVPDYKILHDAGYNVLAYDLRNHGLSSAANGGFITHGFTESRDVIGSLEYARTRPDTRDMIIGLFSRCMGGVSTFAAMTRFPAAFDGVRCLVSPQPITPRYIAQRRLAVIGLGDQLDQFNILLRLRTSIGLERRIPQEWAKNVRVPTFLYQVRGDTLTDPSDVQTMYDNIQWSTRSSSGSRPRRPDGMAIWSSSVVLNRCSSGSTSTCPESQGRLNVVNGLCAVEYGLGWGVVNVNGSRVMTHTGGTMAFASEQLIDLDHHLAMAVLSNIADELSSEAHVRHITAAVLELAGGVKVPKARGPVNPGYAVIDSVVILMSAVLLAVLFLKPRALERTRAAIEITTAIVILVAVPAVFGNSWPVLLKIQPDLTTWGLGMTLLTLAVSSIRTIRILGGNHAATRIA